MSTIEMVVFDMAGTTVHDEDSVNRCVRDALGTVGLTVGRTEVNAVMGLPKPEAIAILVALDTGFDRAITRVVLDRLGWSGNPLIDAMICSDEVPRGRPHPDMIRELMRRMQVVNPRRVAKVGDTPADLEEGRNAGCGLIVGVTQGTHRRQELEPYPHPHLIDTIADLPNLLELDAG